MTATTAPIAQTMPEPTPLDQRRRAPAASEARDWITWAFTISLLLVIYLALQNPYWVPGGDSEVYTTIARNLATGKGYTFNGYPVSMVPPGWPWLMALVMKISPTFKVLKLVNMLCMLGSFAIMYWICRRFVGPTLAALLIVCSGILSHIYALTFWLHSDALFCLVSSAALLLAMQINEGRSQAWRIVMLLVLCSLSVIVRWAGVFTGMTVAAALMTDRFEFNPSRWLAIFRDEFPSPRQPRRWLATLWTRRDRYWIAMFLSVLVTLGTFIALRWALTVPPEVTRVVKIWVAEDQGGASLEKIDKTVATSYELFNPAGGGVVAIVGRVVRWGNWYSFLLWQPLRLGQSNALVGLVSGLVGWMVLIPLLILGFRAARTGKWLWPALLLYGLALDINWPHANARYLVPIAPLIVVGVFKGIQILREHIPAPAFQTTCKVLLGYFVASMLICNGALWGCDVWIAHSKDFYNAYEAGLERDMVYAAHWLNHHTPAPADGEISVSERYVNLGRTRKSQLGLRATTLLTGKAIVTIPSKYLWAGDPRRNAHFLAWARALGVKYALYQTEVSPWRLFHFRVPWLQEAMTGEPAIDVGAGWRLYEIPAEGDEAIRISVPSVENWPTRVPGM